MTRIKKLNFADEPGGGGCRSPLAYPDGTCAARADAATLAVGGQVILRRLDTLATTATRRWLVLPVGSPTLKWRGLHAGATRVRGGACATFVTQGSLAHS